MFDYYQELHVPAKVGESDQQFLLANLQDDWRLNCQDSAMAQV